MRIFEGSLNDTQGRPLRCAVHRLVIIFSLIRQKHYANKLHETLHVRFLIMYHMNKQWSYHSTLLLYSHLYWIVTSHCGDLTGCCVCQLFASASCQRLVLLRTNKSLQAYAKTTKNNTISYEDKHSFILHSSVDTPCIDWHRQLLFKII